MDDVVFRTGKLVTLRPVERRDLPTLRRWINDPTISEYLMRSFPISEKGQEEWFEKRANSNTDFVLAITTRENPTLIGTIGLHGIDWQQRTAVTGTIIGEDTYRSKGYGTDAKMLLLDFAFNALDLFAVLSCVMDSNGRSLAYGKKCGYEEVGRLPNWIRKKDGTRCDVVQLIVTQERWQTLWKEYHK